MGIYKNGNQTILDVHEGNLCKGEICIFHNPTSHRMRLWEIDIRDSRLIDRICFHRHRHIDPDSLDWYLRISRYRIPFGWGKSSGCLCVCKCCSKNIYLLI